MPHLKTIVPLLFAGTILWLATGCRDVGELSKEEQAAGFVSLLDGKTGFWATAAGSSFVIFGSRNCETRLQAQKHIWRRIRADGYGALSNAAFCRSA
jgi:hypothetical protein